MATPVPAPVGEAPTGAPYSPAMRTGRLPFDTAVEIEAIAYVPGAAFDAGPRPEETS